MARNDEHTLNTVLAACLRKRSPLWRVSGTVVSEGLGTLKGTGRPDILIGGVNGPAPIAVETEYEPARTVEQDARARLSKNTAAGVKIEQAVAIRAPKELRDVPQADLEMRLEGASFSCAVWSEPRESEESEPTAARHCRFPEEGWLLLGLDDLATLVETLGVSERAVTRSTDLLEQAVRETSLYLTQSLTHSRPDILPWIACELSQEPGEQTTRMALVILASACVFHETVAGNHGIRSIHQLRDQNGTLVRTDVIDEWTTILKINYYPIFHTAREILRTLPPRESAEVLERFSRLANLLVQQGANRSHDLTGRMFQRLIQDRKFLATFYTRPEAAALLSEIAVGMTDVDWSEREGMKSLRIADLACGTGTLISAAYQALIRRYRRAGWDDRQAHPEMMEESLIAADIMPAAAHLTGAMLSSVHPSLKYERTQVYTLPYGRHPNITMPALGALSLLDRGELLTLFGTGLATGMERLGGRTGEDISEAEAQSSSFALANRSLDLVIMNPPFTRPTNHEIADENVPSFAGFGTTAAEQAEMSAELKRLRGNLVRNTEPGHAPPASDGNAGLASNFIDLAHLKLKPGGTLAMVLPASLALGSAWTASRRLLARHYERLVVISLAASRSSGKSFSADTGMAEVLVVGNKRPDTAGPCEPADAETAWIALGERPRSAAEAMEVARETRRQLNKSAGHPGTAFDLRLGNSIMGQGLVATLADGGLVGVADPVLASATLRLVNKGELSLPRTAGAVSVPLTRLGNIGNRGPLHRDVGGRTDATITARGPFEVVPISGVPTFPILWGHEAARERRLVVTPDSMGQARPGRDRSAAAVWETARRLHFTLDFRLNSQSLAACLTPSPSVGGRAWPSFKTRSEWEKALVVWANSSFGLLLFWWVGSAQQAGRTVLTLSRLPDLPVLDLRELSAPQIDELGASFDALRDTDFLPAHEAHRDPARCELDRRVLADVLGFDDEAMDQVALLREKWCAEPSVHGGKHNTERVK